MLIRAHEEAGRTRKCVTIFQTRKLRVRDGKGLVQGWEAKGPMRPRSITLVFTALLHMLSQRTENSSRVKVRSWVRNQRIKQIQGVPSSHFYNLCESSHAYPLAHWLLFLFHTSTPASLPRETISGPQASQAPLLCILCKPVLFLHLSLSLQIYVFKWLYN